MRNADALDPEALNCPEALVAVKHISRKPLQEFVLHGTYTRVILHCPTCGAFLTSFKKGPPCYENGLYNSECRNCQCGQLINYSDIPHARA